MSNAFGAFRREYLRIRPGYLPYFPNPDEVQIRLGTWRGEIITLTDDTRTGQLSRLFMALDGRSTVGDVLELLPENVREDATAMLYTLFERGVLVRVGNAFGQDKLPDCADGVRSFLNLKPFAADQMGGLLAEANIMVMGAGVIGSRIAVGLAQLGVGELTVADQCELRPDDRFYSPIYIGYADGVSRATALVQVLTSVNPQIRCHALTTSGDPLESVTDAIAGRSLVVVASDRPTPSTWSTVNQAALEAGVPWSMVTMDGLMGLVGPTFIPHQSACYQCYEARLTSNLLHVREFSGYVEHLKRDPSYQSRNFLGLPACADVIAGLFVNDVPDLLMGGCGNTAGRSLAIDFMNLSFEVNDVLKLPRCPACGDSEFGGPSRQLWATVTAIKEARR